MKLLERIRLNRSGLRTPLPRAWRPGSSFEARDAASAAPARDGKAADPLLVIVAYEAEPHLRELIGRLARLSQVRDSWSILLLDDASTDRTAPYAEELFRDHGFRRWMVVHHQVNQGYGGNQKVGYRYALKAGTYTHVALLHGDCQYPPEALPAMLDEALAKRADVVMGTRMWSVASAWRGGMPVYKIIGNKLLTRLQNCLTGQHLSEYHSGLRLYSTGLLRRIPFELNSDGFDFDTEILLQAFYARASVAEIPIPTRYAGEVCHVPGFRYASNVARTTFDYWLQQHGVGCSLRFRDLSGERAIYLDKTAFVGSTHETTVRFLLQAKPRSVLDIGCGQGHIGARLKKQLPGMVYSGSDLRADPPAACDRYWRCDLNRELPPTDPSGHDVVLCLDVLEHLHDPEQFLLRLRQAHSKASRTSFVFSTVNVAFISVRLGLLLGRFEYGDRGILDVDHRCLMTRASFIRLLRESGFMVDEVKYVPVPFQLVFGDNPWTRAATRVWRALTRLFPGAFSFQILVVAHAKPPIPEVTSSFEEGEETLALNMESRPSVARG